MTEIQCNVTNCVNYCNDRCCRPNISVNGPCACGDDQTCCSNFVCADESPTNSCGCHAPNETLEVGCSAKNCTYNLAGSKCNAQNIVVSNCEAAGTIGSPDQTKCATFEMK